MVPYIIRVTATDVAAFIATVIAGAEARVEARVMAMITATIDAMPSGGMSEDICCHRMRPHSNDVRVSVRGSARVRVRVITLTRTRTRTLLHLLPSCQLDTKTHNYIPNPNSVTYPNFIPNPNRNPDPNPDPKPDPNPDPNSEPNPSLDGCGVVGSQPCHTLARTLTVVTSPLISHITVNPSSIRGSSLKKDSNSKPRVHP